jgi:hypothetical protein
VAACARARGRQPFRVCGFRAAVVGKHLTTCAGSRYLRIGRMMSGNSGALQQTIRHRRCRQRTPNNTHGKTRTSRMSKPRFHIRHLCRTYYLSEWWDE